MTSKTAVAPLDRIKILLQAHNQYYKHHGEFFASSFGCLIDLNFVNHRGIQWIKRDCPKGTINRIIPR